VARSSTPICAPTRPADRARDATSCSAPIGALSAYKGGAKKTKSQEQRIKTKSRDEGLHHYLFSQDSIKTVVTTWLRYIDSGYFD
jgi:hypothetical protein